jgi:hypothetical protein
VIHGIPSREARWYWHVVAPLLQTVVDRFDPGYTTDDILSRIESKDMQLWVIDPDIAAVVITEITHFPQYKTLHAPFIAGERMAEWFDPVFDVLEAFANHHGCKYLTGCGRRGWVRQGKPRGYRETYTVLRKPL